MADLVEVTPLEDGAFWRVTFGGSKGNILDRALLAALNQVFLGAASTPGLKAVCLEGADAGFGQPEILLGVFPPVASLVLPERIGRARAEDLCLTGRRVTAGEAYDMGLVDHLASGDPADAALAWAQAHLSGLSASSLRLAVRAIRANLALRLRDELPRLEALYLSELMTTHDATEGLQAFLEKRRPVWRHA